MSTTEKNTYDVVCPCCGQDTAKIGAVKDPQGEGPDRILATCLECGYQEKVDDYLCQLFRNYKFIVYKEKITGSNAKFMTISTRYEDIKRDWERIISIIPKLNGFPLTVYLRGTSIASTTCPICEKKQFTRKGDCVFCNNDGYCVDDLDYLIKFLMENGCTLFDIETKDKNEKAYNVYHKNIHRADILFRTNGFGQKVIIIKKTTAFNDGYQKFLDMFKNLNAGFPEDINQRFRIIVRIEEDL